MLKKIMAAAAVSGLALTSALAQQTTTPPASQPSTPPASSSTPATPPAATAPTTSPTAATSGAAKFVTKQTSDQWLATKFKGTDVIGTNDEKIGDVSDMLFDKDQKIIAYIVGVGGFLGIGQKDVAIDPKSFQMVPASATRSGTGTGSGTTSTTTTTSSADHDNFKLRLSMTKDELKNAPAFEEYSSRPATTSQAPATRPAGAPAPANPAPKQ